MSRYASRGGWARPVTSRRATSRAVAAWLSAMPTASDRDRVRVVRYEDLVAKGELSLRGIAEWLDLPFEPTHARLPSRRRRARAFVGVHVGHPHQAGPATGIRRRRAVATRAPNSRTLRGRSDLSESDRVAGLSHDVEQHHRHGCIALRTTCATASNARHARWPPRPVDRRAQRDPIRARLRRRWRDGTPPRDQWLRTVMIADIEQYLGSLPSRSIGHRRVFVDHV